MQKTSSIELKPTAQKSKRSDQTLGLNSVNSVKMPQVLNGALAASVYVCGAQALGTLAVRSEWSLEDINIVSVFIFFNLFLWTTKNFVDDYRAFDGPPDRGFSLGFTVFFSAAAYFLLALASSSLASGYTCTRILCLYFLVLSAWSAASFVRRSNIDDASDNEKDRQSRRFRWVFLYLYASFLCAVTGYVYTSTIAFVPMSFLIGLFISDSIDSSTFISDNDVAA